MCIKTLIHDFNGKIILTMKNVKCRICTNYVHVDILLKMFNVASELQVKG